MYTGYYLVLILSDIFLSERDKRISNAVLILQSIRCSDMWTIILRF